MSSSRIIAGAMSGTSADGVDVALVEISGTGAELSPRLLHHQHLPYDRNIRAGIFRARSGADVALAELARLGREISIAHARAIKEALTAAKIESNQLTAIAAHGQTLFHRPPDTLQWLDPALLAAQTDCQVVSDFRRADCAAGGQGAPLVPFADFILFRDPTRRRVVLNIGGIANFTSLPAGAAISDVRAFDVGPGNCLLDYICRENDPSGPGYDVDGHLARQGSVVQPVVDQMLSDVFFSAEPPKSTDAPEMIELFNDALSQNARPLTVEDQTATAVQITLAGIWRAIDMLPSRPDDLIASGGGVLNPVILEALGKQSQQRGITFTTTDAHGLPSPAKEALAFALLGAATLDGYPSNIPSVTGARRPVILGSITPKP